MPNFNAPDSQTKSREQARCARDFTSKRRTSLLALLLVFVGCSAPTPEGDASDTDLLTTVYARQNRPDVQGTIGAVSAGHPLAAQAGLDAYVTGEASHHTYFDAAEFRTTVLLAGHYATETFGVKAIGRHLADRFGLQAHFIDQPTGL